MVQVSEQSIIRVGEYPGSLIDDIPSDIPVAPSLIDSIPSGTPSGFSGVEEPKEYNPLEGWWNKLTEQSEGERNAQAYNIVARSELEDTPINEIAAEENAFPDIYEDPTMKEALDMRIKAVTERHVNSKNKQDAAVDFSMAYASGDIPAVEEAISRYGAEVAGTPTMDPRIGNTYQWWARSTADLTGQLHSMLEGASNMAAAGLVAGIATGAVAGGVGAVPGGFIGMKAGGSYGMLREMYHGSLGAIAMDKQAKGMTPEVAYYSSIPVALAITVSERMQLSMIMKKVPGVKAIFAKSLAGAVKATEKQTALTLITGTGKIGLYGSAQESGQQLIEMLGENVSKELNNNLYGTNFTPATKEQMLEEMKEVFIEVLPGILTLGAAGNSIGMTAETMNRKADEIKLKKELEAVIKNTVDPVPLREEIRDDLGQPVDIKDTVPTEVDTVVTEEGDVIPSVDITEPEIAEQEQRTVEPPVTSEEFDNLVLGDETATDQAIDDMYADLRSTGDLYGDFMNGVVSLVGRREAATIDGLIEARATATNRTKEQFAKDHNLQLRTATSENGAVTGSVEFVKDGETIVRAFQQTNLKDIVHEVSHVFRKDLSEAELKATEDALGVKEGNWNVEAEEAYAEAFVEYVQTGKAPTKGLAQTFDRFKQWIAETYTSVAGTSPVSPQMAEIFDKFFAPSKESMQDFKRANTAQDTHTLFAKHGVKSDIREATGQKPLRAGKVVDEHTAFKESLKQQVKAARKAAIEGRNDGYAKAKAKFQATARRVANRSATMRSRAKAKKAVQRTVKGARERKVGGKPTGKFTAPFQEVINEMAAILSMPVADAKEAAAELDANTYPPTTIEAMKRELMALRAGMERMDAASLDELNTDLKEFLKEGRTARAAQIESIMEGSRETAEVIVESLLNVRKNDKEMHPDERNAYDNKIKGVKNGLKRTYDKVRNHMILDFTGMMNMLDMGLKTELGEGAASLFTEMIDQQNLSNAGRRKHNTAMLESVSSIFNLLDEDGKPDTKAAERFLYDEERADKVDVAYYVILDKKGEPTGKERTIRGNKAELRKLFMELQDPTIREVFEKDGMTEEHYRKLFNSLSAQDRQLVAHQLEFYKNYYDSVNEVYRKVYGTNLPKGEFYSPILREGFSPSEDGAISDLLADIKQVQTKKVGARSLTSRVNNTNLTQRQSDVRVFNHYVRQMEHFKAFSEKLMAVNGVFENKQVREAIEDTYGKGFLVLLDGVRSNIATNGSTGTNTGFDNFARSIRANLAKGMVGGKPLAVLKQLTSAAAYSEQMGSKEYVAGLIEFLAHPKKHAEELKAMSLFLQNRADNIDRDISLLTRSSEYTDILSGVMTPRVNEMIMMFVKAGDIGAIYAGGWVYYKHLRKQGVGQQEAIRKMEIFSRNTQQSSELTNLSPAQMGNEFMKLMTMFTSSQRQYAQKMDIAFEGMQAGKVTGAEFSNKMALFGVLLPVLFQVVAQGGASDEEDAKALATAVLASPLSAIPLAGPAWQFGMNDFIKGHTYGRGIQLSPIASPVESLVKGKSRLFRETGKMAGLKDVDYRDMLLAIREMAAIMEYAGIPGKAVVGTAIGATDILRGDVYQGAMEISGMSPYASENRANKE